MLDILTRIEPQEWLTGIGISSALLAVPVLTIGIGPGSEFAAPLGVLWLVLAYACAAAFSDKRTGKIKTREFGLLSALLIAAAVFDIVLFLGMSPFSPLHGFFSDLGLALLLQSARDGPNSVLRGIGDDLDANNFSGAMSRLNDYKRAASDAEKEINRLCGAKHASSLDTICQNSDSFASCTEEEIQYLFHLIEDTQNGNCADFTYALSAACAQQLEDIGIVQPQAGCTSTPPEEEKKKKEETGPGGGGTVADDVSPLPSCESQGAYLCPDNEVCAGDVLDASDYSECCTVPCLGTQQ